MEGLVDKTKVRRLVAVVTRLEGAFEAELQRAYAADELDVAAALAASRPVDNEELGGKVVQMDAMLSADGFSPFHDGLACFLLQVAAVWFRSRLMSVCLAAFREGTFFALVFFAGGWC